MDKIWTILLVSMGVMASGRDEHNNPEAVSKTKDSAASPTSEIANPLAGCYRMITGKDTALLQLDAMDSLIAGKLQYQRFEKDDNTGELKGVVSGNQITADYTFISEGRSSVREVVFLIKGDSLLEAYGEIKMVRDTARFLNSNDLKYLPGAFTKVECK